jgi:Protein of unknown function (DUF2167)
LLKQSLIRNEICAVRLGETQTNEIVLRSRRLSFHNESRSPIFRGMKLPAVVALLAAVTISIVPVCAQERPKTKEEAQALTATLRFQRGEVVLKNGLATLKIPDGVEFLDGRDAQTVLVKLWGNPPMADPLGLLMPVNVGPLNPESWR